MARLTIYRSDDAGAPVLDGTVSSLINLLQACLIDGYAASVTSITSVAGVATVITPVHHHLQTGQSVIIAGANEGDYNGTFTVTVIDAVTFLYPVGGAPASPATGTITFAKLGAGWTKPYTGTNKAAFLQGAGSNANLLRVDDSGPGAGGAREARVTAYETMSDVDTGTHPYPTAAQGLGGVVAALCVRKSNTADATARSWIIAADARTVWGFFKHDGTTYLGWGFGEFYSMMTGDLYRQFICARNLENSGIGSSDVLDTVTNVLSGAGPGTAFFVDRGHNGTGNPVQIGKHTDVPKNGGSGTIGQNNNTGAIPYTNPANGAFYLSRLWLHDIVTPPATSIRGRYRGLWCFCHDSSVVADLEEVVGTGELGGKSFLFVKPSGNGGMYTIETTNTVETN